MTVTDILLLDNEILTVLKLLNQLRKIAVVLQKQNYVLYCSIATKISHIAKSLIIIHIKFDFIR